jgi:hypothetical protein
MLAIRKTIMMVGIITAQMKTVVEVYHRPLVLPSMLLLFPSSAMTGIQNAMVACTTARKIHPINVRERNACPLISL